MNRNVQKSKLVFAQQALFLAVLTLALVFLITLRTPADPDMWWHLSSGRAMWQRGAILLEDVFSYTRAGAPWTNAFWISDLAMYALYKIGGFFAITLGVSLMAALTMGVVYRQARSPLPIRVGVVILATLAMTPIWSPRPQLFSFFLVAGLDFWLSRRGESLDKRFWLLVPLFVLWPNLHGGFIFGFLLLMAFIVAKALEPLLRPVEALRPYFRRVAVLTGFVVLAALAVGLNPNGLAIWKLPFYTVDVSQAIQEWRSPDFHRIYLHPILWLLFLLIAALGFSARKISLFDLFKTLGFAYMTFYAQRSMALFAIVAAPVTARYLSAAWEDWKAAPIGRYLEQLTARASNRPVSPTVSKALNLTIVGLIFAVSLLRAFVQSLPVFVYQTYPKSAVTWVEARRPDGRMFNTYGWGGYLTWDLPEYPVFIDGRADLYGDEILDQWWQIVRATDEGLALLDFWGVDFALLEPAMPLVDALIAQGWQVRYEDGTAVVIGR